MNSAGTTTFQTGRGVERLYGIRDAAARAEAVERLAGVAGRGGSGQPSMSSIRDSVRSSSSGWSCPEKGESGSRRFGEAT